MCGFTLFAWLEATENDDAETAAKFLAETVFLDLAGFPMVLRSDRGSAYVTEVVKALNERFHVEQAFGAAYHPQAQGAIEGSHQRPNNILRAYSKQNCWARWVKVAQWALRASPRPSRGGFSPYELVTGLKPQGPLDKLWKRTDVQQVDPGTYVSQLVEQMSKIQEQVKLQIHEDAKRSLSKQNQKGDVFHEFAIGDWAFLRKPPPLLRAATEGGNRASERLAPYADARPCQIVKNLKASQHVLADSSGNTDLPFGQPVHASRLIPYNLCSLEAPLNSGEVLKLELIARDGKAYAAQVAGQTATGLVRLKFENKDLNGLYDLSVEEYRWLA